MFRSGRAHDCCLDHIEVSRGLELVGAVDVVSHLQRQPGGAIREHLSHGVLRDGGLLQDDHRLLAVQLGIRFIMYEVIYVYVYV